VPRTRSQNICTLPSRHGMSAFRASFRFRKISDLGTRCGNAMDQRCASGCAERTEGAVTRAAQPVQDLQGRRSTCLHFLHRIHVSFKYNSCNKSLSDKDYLEFVLRR
jgi:hypothetical protein